MGRTADRSFVLKVCDHGETDKIVTLLSADKGRISAIAKGARRSKKRFVNKLEPFSLLEAEIVPQRHSSLGMLRDAELIDSFHPLRCHYKRYVAASLVVEAILSWTYDHDPDPKQFTLLSWCLSQLCHAPDVSVPVTIFLVRLTAIQGFMPCFDTCRHCGREITAAGPLTFSAATGGVVCARCRSHTAKPFLHPGTAKILGKALSLPTEALSRLKFTRHDIDAALNIIIDYNRYLLQREFSSWDQLKTNLRQSGNTGRKGSGLSAGVKTV